MEDEVPPPAPAPSSRLSAPRDRQSSECRAAACRLRSFSISTSRTGGRKIRARRHPVPDLVKVALQVLLERRQRHAIHARSTSVRLHPLVGFPDELLRNVIRLCLRQRLLPLLVGQRLFGWRVGSLCSARITRLHRSLRTRPSLHPRIGTRLLMGPPLGGLPWHQGTGSHVPHKSLVLVSRRLHAGRRSDSRQAPPGLHPRPTTKSLVSTTSLRFRHVINGSLAFDLPAHT